MKPGWYTEGTEVITYTPLAFYRHPWRLARMLTRQHAQHPHPRSSVHDVKREEKKKFRDARHYWCLFLSSWKYSVTQSGLTLLAISPCRNTTFQLGGVNWQPCRCRRSLRFCTKPAKGACCLVNHLSLPLFHCSSIIVTRVQRRDHQVAGKAISERARANFMVISFYGWCGIRAKIEKQNVCHAWMSLKVGGEVT